MGLAAGVLQCRRWVGAEIDPDTLSVEPCPQRPCLAARGQYAQRQPGYSAVSEVPDDGTCLGGPRAGVRRTRRGAAAATTRGSSGLSGSLPPDTARCHWARGAHIISVLLAIKRKVDVEPRNGRQPGATAPRREASLFDSPGLRARLLFSRNPLQFINLCLCGTFCRW